MQSSFYFDRRQGLMRLSTLLREQVRDPACGAEAQLSLSERLSRIDADLKSIGRSS